MKPRRIRTVNRRGREAARVRADVNKVIAKPAISNPKTSLTQSKK